MKTTIQINGKTYDAHTGQLLQNDATHSPVTHKISDSKLSRPPLGNSKTLDGITRRKSTTVAPEHKKPSNVTHSPANYQQASPSIANQNNTQNSILQKSYTLHRKAVHKPTNSPKPYIHSVSTVNNKKPNHNLAETKPNKPRASFVPDQRLKRAYDSKKSSVISKFGNSNSGEPTKLSPYLSVKPLPNQSRTKAPSIPPPALHHYSKRHIPAPHKPKKFVFEDQIKNANAHLLKPVKKQRTTAKFIKKLHLSPKKISVMAGCSALLILGSFFAYQNIPTISMRIAANQAGFIGTIPNKVPAGYAFEGPVKAVDNALAVSYKSTSDDRQFVLSQRPTNWSSESLLTNFLQESKLNYQIYKENGLTIYVYNGSNATWVDKGIWYNLNGNQNSLSASQLLEIASSS